MTSLCSRSLSLLVLVAAPCACRRMPSAERPTARDAGPTGTHQDAHAPAVEGPILVVNDERGERDLIWSGVRVSMIHGTIQVGSEPVPAIVWVTPLAGGWLFLTEDGSLFHTTSFTGAVRRAGAVAPPYRPLRACRGRLAVVDDAGTLWLSDGTEPPARAALPEPGRALTAVFLDARRGIVVLEGGQLARTGDGGAHWHRVDLGGEAAWDVERVADDARIETTAGPRAIDDSGALRPATEELPPPLASPPDDEIVELRRALSRQRPAAGATEGTPALPARTPDDAARLAPPWTLVSEAYLCTPDRAPTRQKSPGTPPAVPGTRSVLLVGPGVRAALQIRTSRGRWLARAAWEGVDGQGSFSGASSESPLATAPSADADAGDPGLTAWSLEAAWRSGAVFRRCADERACTFLHAFARGPLEPLDPLPEIARSSAPYSILPVGRAGALLLFRDRRVLVSRLPNRDRLDRPVMRERLLGVDTALIPGPRGTMRTHAVVRLDANAAAALARRGGVWGYAAVEGDDARALRFHPLFPAPAAPAELRLPAPAPLRLCGAASAAATELAGVRLAEILRAAAPLIADPDARAVLELSQDQICLRSLDSPSSIEPGGDHGLHVAAGPDGLTGVLDDGAQRQAIRCLPRQGVTD